MNPKEIDLRMKEALGNINATAAASSKAIKSIFENIIKGLETLLKSQYDQNRILLKSVAANPMNPEFAKLADVSVKPLVASLQSIHQELAEANKEMQKMQTTIDLLQGRAVTNPNIKSALDSQLNQLITLNKDYKDTYELMQKQAMVLGDPKFAQPGQKENIDKTLKGLYTKAHELKQQAKQKQAIVTQVEEVTRPTPRR